MAAKLSKLVQGGLSHALLPFLYGKTLDTIHKWIADRLAPKASQLMLMPNHLQETLAALACHPYGKYNGIK
jgi:hypothetical protein